MVLYSKIKIVNGMQVSVYQCYMDKKAKKKKIWNEKNKTLDTVKNLRDDRKKIKTKK